MATPYSSSPTPSQGKLTGRNRRLLYEWQRLDERLSRHSDIAYRPTRLNAAGMPVQYLVTYHLRSICGVEHADQLGQPGASNAPVFADEFLMLIDLPADYPCVDAAPVFRFLTTDTDGQDIPHPWHPNIRYFGCMAGRVCLNQPDTYTELAWGVERIASYLRYERYHAVNEPPYPEDLQVAAWVVRQGEPNGWVCFDSVTT